MDTMATYESREDSLLAAALRADEFRRPLPPGMAGRVEARLRALATEAWRPAPPRWLKVAASLAAIASFAAFAATVAMKFTGDDETGGTGESNEPGVAQSAADETFEEIISEESAELKKQEEKQAMNTRAAKSLAAGALVAATAFSVPSAQCAVRSSVFDDVKIWYKGSAGNAVGTADSDGNRVGLVKNLPNLADPSSAMHGGEYYWWGWRMSYENQPVVCPYAGVSLDSTPCMVVNSPVKTNSLETVTINGEEMEQPNITYRTGNLHFTNWVANCETPCANYTVFLRFRNESVNPVPGNHNRVFSIGQIWTGTAGAAAGADWRMRPEAALSDYAHPRIVVGNNQTDYSSIRIKNGSWADCVIAVDGQTVTTTFCWNDGASNLMARVSKTYPTTGPLPAVAANGTARISGEGSRESCSFTYGVECASSSWTYGFRGAFHQIAFWERTLNDNEIREAMAAESGRPNLVHVGIEGNGIAEFKTSGQTSNVSNTGAWEYLNPALSSANPTATISFSCPALWAGMPQWLRLPVASGSGMVSATVNGTTVGECTVAANRVRHIFVPENVICSGANTLVLTRTEGTFSFDAVTLGGSWRFGESVSSFSSPNDSKNSPDKLMFNPACGCDKLHSYELMSNEMCFDFFVPADMVGAVKGIFQSRAYQAGASTSFDLFVNGMTKGGPYVLKNGSQPEIKIVADDIVAGWNRISWKSYAGSNWAKMDWHKFTILPPPKGMLIYIR